MGHVSYRTAWCHCVVTVTLPRVGPCRRLPGQLEVRQELEGVEGLERWASRLLPEPASRWHDTCHAPPAAWHVHVARRLLLDSDVTVTRSKSPDSDTAGCSLDKSVRKGSNGGPVVRWPESALVWGTAHTVQAWEITLSSESSWQGLVLHIGSTGEDAGLSCCQPTKPAAGL